MTDRINQTTPSVGQPATPPAAGESSASKAAALAQQFESMLLSQMLHEMRVLEGDDEESGFGSSIMGDTMRTELALALSRAGGMGLAPALSEAFARIEEAETAGTDKHGHNDAVTLPTRTFPAGLPAMNLPVAAEPISLTLPEAKVSSEFGWRRDPLNGQQRFHHGSDLRMADGQDVRSAGNGVVTSVRDAGGYGLMVAVDHGDGIETRYAHLSAATVKVGDTIAAGQVIARSGNSGRSSGPHLHFEVREAGQPVDPSRFAGRLTVVAD